MEKINLRLPAEMKIRLAEEAVKNGRSVNSEILIRLRKSLDAWKR